jgi:hypothetical protein
MPAPNPAENANFVESNPSEPEWLETGERVFENEFAAEEDAETAMIMEGL